MAVEEFQPGSAARPPAAPLILFPGFLETASIWQPLLDRHPDLAMPIRILPLPGHDPDTRPDLTRLEGNAFVDDHAARLRAEFPGRKMRLVGHSTGGLVALDLARRHPDLVDSILLVGPLCSGRMRRFETLWLRLLTAARTGPALTRLSHRAGLAHPRLFNHLCAVAQADPRMPCTVPDRMRGELARCMPESLRTVLVWLSRQCLLETLPEVQAPVLSIIGRHDPVVPPEHQIALLKRLPNARAQLLAAGHLPFLEAPEAFDRSFRYWLVYHLLLRVIPKPTA